MQNWRTASLCLLSDSFVQIAIQQQGLQNDLEIADLFGQGPKGGSVDTNAVHF